MNKAYFTLLLFLFWQLNARAAFQETAQNSNRIYDERIRTVQVYREGWNLSYPYIRLNSNEELVIGFDLLGSQPETYYYTFIHCDKDWNSSDMFPNNYLEGFTENPVEDYSASFNTTVSYYHYGLRFPNERVKPTMSGNYLLVVYPVNKPGSPAFTQRFLVFEDMVKINPMVHRPQMTKERDLYQQVDFTIAMAGPGLIDPYRNIYAFILQNGRWDNCKRNLKPEFYTTTELKYNSLSDKTILSGGNEFRYFDIKSLRYQSEYVKNIAFNPPYYNVFLFPSENREFKPYFYTQDFNGKYYIAIQEGRKPEIDADYVNVYFTLASDHALAGGKVYVSGGLNNWSFDDNNLMSYNEERKQYECTLLLKQGWYNYEYAFLKDGATDGTASVFEGSHYETENDYVILAYYRNPRERYDRLVGCTTFNTLNRIAD